MTPDRMTEAMLEHPQARLALDNSPEDGPRKWLALDYGCFLRQAISTSTLVTALKIKQNCGRILRFSPMSKERGLSSEQINNGSRFRSPRTPTVEELCFKAIRLSSG